MEKFAPRFTTGSRQSFGRSLLQGLGAAAGALLLALPVVAQASTQYSVSVTPQTYVPLVPATDPAVVPLTISTTGGSLDDGAAPATLPFPVRFFGVDYNEIAVGTNGYITFGPWSTAYTGTGGGADSNQAAMANNFAREHINHAVPSTRKPNGLIAVWWDDHQCVSAGSSLHTKTMGTAPNRTFVVQYTDCYRRSTTTQTWRAQVWFFEGSTTIQVKYGTAIDTSSITTATIGIEDHTGTVGWSPLTCAAGCTAANFPTNSVVTYSQGPDLAVTSVSTATVGYAGVTASMSAEVRNVGGVAAEGVRLRFLASRDNQLSGDDIEVGYAADVVNLAPNATHLFQLNAPLPAQLTEGPWFLLAQVDPDGAITEGNESNNVGHFGPFQIGIPAPDLRVSSLSLPARTAPGERLALSWQLQNQGNLGAVHVPYDVILSRNDFVSAMDVRVYRGSASAEAGVTVPVVSEFDLPADLRPGSYWVAVQIDPDGTLHELDRTNNLRVSSASFPVASTEVAIAMDAFPSAAVGSPYCVALDAVGGNGTYQWVVTDGQLPPGLALEEVRAGATRVATTLCGTPSAVGHFTFSLQVSSGGATASETFGLAVERSVLPLVVSTRELPTAIFQGSYREELRALGGVAPYEWRRTSGALPPGISLSRNGHLVGVPAVDGSFSFGVEVQDSTGKSATASLVLHVAAPARLTCVTRSLPTQELDSRYDVQLLAGGGARPYTWASVDSRRLSNGTTDPGQVFGAAPPPGLALSTGGKLTGKPAAAGRYLWTVEVKDATGDSTPCAIAFDVSLPSGLTVTTSGLAPVWAGAPVQAQLEATGGEGRLSWRLAPGERLPEGLSLADDGSLAGSVALAALEGAPSRRFSFLVEVRDAANRYAVAALSLEVHATRPTAPSPEEDDEGGCQAGMGGPSLLALAAVLGLAGRRRRSSGC